MIEANYLILTMWKSKEIKDVSASSVIELKAELFKATEQFQKDKKKVESFAEPVSRRIVTDGRKIPVCPVLVFQIDINSIKGC
jgi:hypothetical protein